MTQSPVQDRVGGIEERMRWQFFKVRSYKIDGMMALSNAYMRTLKMRNVYVIKKLSVYKIFPGHYLTHIC